MGKTDFLQDERLQWLRFVLHPSSHRPEIRDWVALYQFAQKQAVEGICSPAQLVGNLPPKELLLKWYVSESKIRHRNKVMSRQAVILTEKFREAGMSCCILKGQGNAMLYPDPALRMSGDIDVWVDADKTLLQEYVRKQFPDAEVGFKHIKFPLFEDTEVDVHDTPLIFYHPGHNRRLQQWLESNKAEQMSRRVRLPDTDGEISVPTPAFNAVYQLGHILIHLEDKGIGLRQFVDYYYVLDKLGDASVEEKEEIRRTWKKFGLQKLARAVMWIEREMLGLEEKYLLAPPDERMGRLLADDIMEGGNFGQFSSRRRFRKYGTIAKSLSNTWHMLRLSACFPGEAFFRTCRKFKTIFKINIT